MQLHAGFDLPSAHMVSQAPSGMPSKDRDSNSTWLRIAECGSKTKISISTHINKWNNPSTVSVAFWGKNWQHISVSRMRAIRVGTQALLTFPFYLRRYWGFGVLDLSKKVAGKAALPALSCFFGTHFPQMLGWCPVGWSHSYSNLTSLQISFVPDLFLGPCPSLSWHGSDPIGLPPHTHTPQAHSSLYLGSAHREWINFFLVFPQKHPAVMQICCLTEKPGNCILVPPREQGFQGWLERTKGRGEALQFREMPREEEQTKESKAGWGPRTL